MYKNPNLALIPCYSVYINKVFWDSFIPRKISRYVKFYKGLKSTTRFNVQTNLLFTILFNLGMFAWPINCAKNDLNNECLSVIGEINDQLLQFDTKPVADKDFLCKLIQSFKHTLISDTTEPRNVNPGWTWQVDHYGKNISQCELEN